MGCLFSPDMTDAAQQTGRCLRYAERQKQTNNQTNKTQQSLFVSKIHVPSCIPLSCDFTPRKQPGNLMENVLMAAHIKQHYTWQVMRLSGSQSMNDKASNATQVCAVVMSFLIEQGKQIKRRRSFPDCSRLTSGCISACISASCTALGT